MDTDIIISTPASVVKAPAADVLELYTIENKRGTKLIVSNCGAAVVSLFLKDKAGKLLDIVLGYNTVQEYLDDEYYMGTVVGRYANRIGGESVMINGERYKLSVKEGGYHHHGGDIGFNKKIFKACAFKNENSTGISFKYTSPHMEEGFPGEFQLEVIYTLDDENNWTIEYKGLSDRNTIVNLTQHTYFNLSGNGLHTVDEHEIKISARYYLPVNNLQLPIGELEEVINTPFDFTSIKKIGKDIFSKHEQLLLSYGYDHSYVLEKEHTSSLKHAAIVKEKLTGIIMNVFTTEPAIHFYTGNFLNHVKGKNNIAYNQRSGFCLETQHYPDAPNHPSFPSTLLKAGDPFYSKTIYSFSLDQA